VRQRVGEGGAVRRVMLLVGAMTVMAAVLIGPGCVRVGGVGADGRRVFRSLAVVATGAKVPPLNAALTLEATGDTNDMLS
jgi:hypothetical protein